MELSWCCWIFKFFGFMGLILLFPISCGHGFEAPGGFWFFPKNFLTGQLCPGGDQRLAQLGQPLRVHPMHPLGLPPPLRVLGRCLAAKKESHPGGDPNPQQRPVTGSLDELKKLEWNQPKNYKKKKFFADEIWIFLVLLNFQIMSLADFSTGFPRLGKFEAFGCCCFFGG